MAKANDKSNDGGATVLEDDELIVAPFGIEADHPRNSDLLLQSIPNCRLRSSIDGSRSIIDAKTGDVRVPLDQARALSSFPRTPGMQLMVNPMRGAYVVLDPLEDPANEQVIDRVNKYLKQNTPIRSNSQIKGVPKQKGELDKDRMKTLCREILDLHDAGHIKVVQGMLPDRETVDSLPGNYLLNPGSRVQNTQPRYEKDLEGWVDRLSQNGG